MPVPTATSSAAPAAGAGAPTPTRVDSSQNGVFSVEMPAGWSQNSDPYTVPSITLDDPAGGNLQITSLRYAQPPRTITQEFSAQRDAIVAAFPACSFPAGADVIQENIGGNADANYRVLTCGSMPFTYTIFTANGPGGELLAGHDADFGGKADRWKDVVRSVITKK